MTLTIGTTGRYEPGATLTATFATMLPPLATGMRQRRNMRPNAKRRWELTWRCESSSELASIVTEFDTAKGKAGRFTFRPPGESYNISVRFGEDALHISKFAPDRHNVSIVVVEDVRL